MQCKWECTRPSPNILMSWSISPKISLLPTCFFRLIHCVSLNSYEIFDMGQEFEILPLQRAILLRLWILANIIVIVYHRYFINFLLRKINGMNFPNKFFFKCIYIILKQQNSNKFQCNYFAYSNSVYRVCYVPFF